MTTTRRGFVRGVSAFSLLPTLRSEPELVLWNGVIHTQDPAQPRAQALAVANGRLLAVGSNDDVLVVLGRDPLREPPGSLISIPVERTMVGGRWVFES
jgi:predicted amidohydrolase YtcJ